MLLFFKRGVYAEEQTDSVVCKVQQDRSDRPLGVLLAHKTALSVACFFCCL